MNIFICPHPPTLNSPDSAQPCSSWGTRDIESSHLPWYAQAKSGRTYCSGADFQVLHSWARDTLLGDILPLEGLEPLLLVYLVSLSGSVLSGVIADQGCSCSAMEQSKGSYSVLETPPAAQPNYL